MPELPEVETVVRDLRQHLIGRTILEFHNDWSNCINLPLSKMQAGLAGQKIMSLSRRGKYIVIALESGQLLIIHLKMSGRLHLRPFDYSPQSKREAIKVWLKDWQTSADYDRHAHNLFWLDQGAIMLFVDPRKFGRVWLVDDFNEAKANLGLEPFGMEFTQTWLFEQLQRSKRQLKAFLLDQSKIAGLGNIYCDEGCFQAGLRPTRLTNSINQREAAKLYQSILKVLNLGINHKGADLGDNVYRGGEFAFFFYVYGRTGQACKKCKNPIQKIKVAARSTHFCDNCQS